MKIQTQKIEANNTNITKENFDLWLITLYRTFMEYYTNSEMYLLDTRFTWQIKDKIKIRRQILS